MFKFLQFKKWQKTLFSFSLMIGLSWGMAALAVSWRPLVQCGIVSVPEYSAPCTLCHLYQLISNIINLALFEFAVPGAILLFLGSGIVFITSGGNQSRVELAKKIFINTIIGIAIAFAAWVIVDTLLQTIATGTFSEGWSTWQGCN